MTTSLELENNFVSIPPNSKDSTRITSFISCREISEAFRVKVYIFFVPLSLFLDVGATLLAVEARAQKYT